MVTLVNRAKMTIVSTGTGPLTLGAAVNGYQSLVAAGVSTGDVVRYIIEDGDAWEIGLGTYSANTSSLSRSVSESSNAGAPIALSGKAIVFLGLSAADINARVEITDPRLSNAREWAAGTISQAEAEAGTATTRRAFTAQRIRQAILGWWTGSSDKAKLDGIAAGAQVNSVTAVAGRTGDVTLAVEDVQNAVGTTDNRLTNSREWTASTITQAEAEAGTATTRRAFTAQRVRQAILGWWTGSSDKAKLDGIAAGAQVNVATNLGITGSGNTRSITSSTGTNVTIPVATSSTAGLMATGDKSKLDGIAVGAQVNTVTSVAGKTGAITLVKADVGLASVDNTSDVDKPISTAMQTALSGKVDTTDNRLTNSREWTASTISQAEAEAGTATTRRAFTAQRMRQAILGWWNGSSDKAKLDGIAAGAQVNVATNLGYTSAASAGTLTSSTGSNATLPAATTAVAGLLTSADKTKLDGIAVGAQVNVATNLGITGTGNSRTITSSTGTNVTIPVATSSTAGLMATGDKSKLDGIAAGAQVNVATNLGVAGGTTGGPTITSSTGSNATLPIASTTASGVVTTGAQSWAGAKTFTGVVTAPDFVTTSDARLKQDIREITDALDKLRRLQGITYQIADDPRRRIGLLAQDVQRVAPEAVLETNGILRLSYGNLVGLLVEAIKDLALEVDQLKRTQT